MAEKLLKEQDPELNSSAIVSVGFVGRMVSVELQWYSMDIAIGNARCIAMPRPMCCHNCHNQHNWKY